MIRALIFDFDGVILDTETAELQAWQEIYRAHGHELPLARWVDDIGRGPDSITFSPHDALEALVGHSLDREALHAQRWARFLALIDAAPVLPGVERYITDAQRVGLRLGIASSSSHAWVDGHLAQRELLAHFAVIRCADDVTRTKPHPELYQAACAALGVSPTEAFAIEDSPNGIAAAKAAGLTVLAVPTPLTAGLPLAEADYRLPSLTAMPLTAVLRQCATSRVPLGGK